MRIRVPVLVFVALGLFYGPHSSAADVGPLVIFKGGGVVAPEAPHESIRLDSQEVMIRLKSATYAVDVVFNLFNEGDTARESIGFPKWVASHFDSYPTFLRFEGSINGRRIEFSDEVDQDRRRRFHWIMSSGDWSMWADRPMKEERQWKVSRVTFPGHAQTRIRISYEAQYFTKHVHHAAYVYGTGSLWKGNIGKAVFIVDATGVGGNKSISTFFRKELRLGSGPEPGTEAVQTGPRAIPIGNHALCFEIRDFEPHPDANLSITTKGWLFGKRNYVKPKPTLGPPPPPPGPPPPSKRHPTNAGEP